MFDKPELNNPHFNDCYFAYDDGYEESLYVFIDGNNIPEVLHKKGTWIIGETGFGTGLNLMALLSVIEKEAPLTIRFITVEKYPLAPQRVSELLSPFIDRIGNAASSVISAWDRAYKSILDGWNQLTFSYLHHTIEIQLFVGDVQDMFKNLETKCDIWFLDGHSPDKNPDMWNVDIMKEVGNHSHSETTLATFSAAGVVKVGLRRAGFFIKRRKGYGGKRHMIQGWFEKESSDGSTQ